MKLYDLFEAPEDNSLLNNDSMHDDVEDQRHYELDDTRKPKLTLKDLNKLRKYRDFKNTQDAKRNAIVSTVYHVNDMPANQ